MSTQRRPILKRAIAYFQKNSKEPYLNCLSCHTMITVAHYWPNKVLNLINIDLLVNFNKSMLRFLKINLYDLTNDEQDIKLKCLN